MADENTNLKPSIEVPEAEPLPEKKKTPPSAAGSRWARFKNWYSGNKKLSVPLTVLVLALILAAVPFTRYGLAGLAVKHDLSVKVLDSETNTPVSGATVTAGQASAETNAAGVATLRHVKAGHHTVSITKKYYTGKSINLLSPILSQKTTPQVELVATGRQVKVTVTNSINKKPLEGAVISVAGTTAKTDSSGNTVLVLPAAPAEQPAKVSLSGYNDAKVTVKISNDKVQDNQFSLTPAGEVYFLSKLSGKIDVVKTNLDGTGRQTVLAGTGNEDDRNTVLLASRDWKYLALLSRRAGNTPTLYLINTSDDSLTTIDQGSEDINLVGWLNNSFIYSVTRNDVQLWQSGRQMLKSYNPQTQKALVLDKTTATGTGNFDYISQTLGAVYAYNSQVYYIMNWAGGFSVASADLAAKQATFNSINPDGTGKKAIRSFKLAAGAPAIDVNVDEEVANPDKILLYFYDGLKDNFYDYAGGQVKADASMTTDSFYSTDYSTYLQSPSGNNTFWSESRDGKNTLFIGDEDGQNGKQIATLSDYSPYGWYTDNYLLVSKNASELYIMPADGSQDPVKISDYHKPAVSFAGYGGGYGGL